MNHYNASNVGMSSNMSNLYAQATPTITQQITTGQNKLVNDLNFNDVGSPTITRAEQRRYNTNRKEYNKHLRNKRHFEQSNRANYKSPEFVASVGNSNFRPGPYYEAQNTADVNSVKAEPTNIAKENTETVGSMSYGNQKNEGTACDAYSGSLAKPEKICMVLPRTTWYQKYKPCDPISKQEEETIKANQDAKAKGYFELEDFLKYGPTCSSGFMQPNIYQVRLPDNKMCYMRKQTFSGRAIYIQCTSFRHNEPLDVTHMTIPQMMDSISKRIRNRRSSFDEHNYEAGNNRTRRNSTSNLGR